MCLQATGRYGCSAIHASTSRMSSKSALFHDLLLDLPRRARGFVLTWYFADRFSGFQGCLRQIVGLHVLRTRHIQPEAEGDVPLLVPTVQDAVSERNRCRHEGGSSESRRARHRAMLSSNLAAAPS